jgi:hypothetical protein
MEMSQGNSLCSYRKQKMSFFSFFYQMGEQECHTGPVWRLAPVRGRGVCGGRVQEGEYGANTVYTVMQMEK